jgi:ParB-like chromosome segregation protein Spo0J
MSIPRVVMILGGELRPNQRNARTRSNKQIGQVADGIPPFGWADPILTDENRELIAGFGRWKAAEHPGPEGRADHHRDRNRKAR